MISRLSPYLFLIIITVISCSKGSNSLKAHKHRGMCMDTLYNITLVLPAAYKNVEKVFQEMDEALVYIDQTMSHFNTNSPVARFNASRDTTYFKINNELYTVVNSALEISRFSMGSYDVTVGALTDLWGFGIKQVKRNLPSDFQISEALAKTGYKKIALKQRPPAIKKSIQDLTIDLSSIAKGYSVDYLSQILLSKGISNYMIEVGGEIYVHGHNLKRSSWRIGVVNPDKKAGGLIKILSVSNIAIATSGNYERYYEIDEKKYAHIINPHTGKPITHSLTSVTVLAENCRMADGWATALYTLGSKSGYTMAQKQGLAAYFIEIDKNGNLNEYMTSDFSNFAGR